MGTTIPFQYDGFANVFELDENTAYVKDKMEEDIKHYGLFKPEDLAAFCSEELFHAIHCDYLGVAFGKGLITFEEVVYWGYEMIRQMKAGEASGD